MAAAALTPRVRIIVVCDEAAASDTEDGVYTLDLFRCPFPKAGVYAFEIWFTTRNGDAAQKGELPFYVVAAQE